MGIIDQAKRSLKRLGNVVLPKARRVGYAITRTLYSNSRTPDFEAPPVDFHQIEKAYARDGFVRHAVDKYVELILRSGYDFKGKNEKAMEYIRTRLRMMAAMSDQTTDELITAIVEDVTKFTNSFMVKVYMPKDYTPPFRAQGLDGKPPLAAVFPLPTTTMKVAQDKHGNIVKYQQRSPATGETKEFSPRDMIHIAYKKDRGRIFSVPWLWPVLEDIMMLRQLEENVNKLFHKHLFPLIHAKVGLPIEGFQADDTEIEKAIEELNNMPEDGIFVSSERIDLIVKGLEGSALNPEPFLKHMEKRIFTGIGLSELEMGRGGESNRGTADTLSESARDRVKMKQHTIENGINKHIIIPLLLEGGFNPVLNPDDLVEFQFREIDLDAIQKKENGLVFLWEHNAITFEELRRELGRDPLKDMSGLFLHLITLAQIEATAKAQADLRAQTDNKQQPENQHGKKPNKDKPENQ